MLRLITVAGVIAGLVLVGVLTPVLAGTTSSWALIAAREDRFYNWDNRSQTASGNNVDRPVTMIFRIGSNHTKDSVKNAIGGSSFLTSNMYFRGSDDGINYFWDSDNGRKHGSCGDWYHHIRLYAHPSNKYLYNQEWGRYVLGATHIDKNECTSPEYGWSETAEEWFAALLRGKDYRVDEDWISLVNTDNRGYVTEHGETRYYLSNGFATVVYISDEP